jgi:O-antigen/teichoic acid export membrane protein
MGAEAGRHEKHRFVANTFLNGASQFATMFASLVFMPMLINSFGISLYGLFMLASSVASYASLADFGVGTALTKMVAEHHSTQDRRSLADVISSALVFYTVIGVAVAAVMAIVGLYAGVIFKVTPDQAQLMRDMLLLGAAFQLVYWPASTARYVIAGYQRYDTLAKTGVLAAGLGIVATLFVIVRGEGPLVLVGLTGVVTCGVAIVNIVLALRISGIRPSLRGASLARLRAIFAFSWAVFFMQVSDALFYQQTDKVILGIFASPASVGLYEPAAKFNSLITFFSGLTVSAVLPLASSMEAQGRHTSLRQLFVRGTKYIAALVAPTALVLMVLAEPIIVAWLGPKFTGMGLVAAVLLLPHLFVSLGLMGDAIVVSKGRIAKRIPYIVAQTVLNVVLSIALVGKYGVLGVAIGTCVAHLLDFPFHMHFLLAETGVSTGDWLRKVIAPVYPQLLIPLGLGLLLRSTAIASTLLGTGVLAAALLAAYWAAVYATGLSFDERFELKTLVSTAVSRLRAGSR